MNFDKFVFSILERYNSLEEEYLVTMKEYGFPMKIDGVKKNRWSRVTKATSPKKAALNVFHHYFQQSGLAIERRGIEWNKFKNSIKVKKIS